MKNCALARLKGTKEESKKGQAFQTIFTDKVAVEWGGKDEFDSDWMKGLNDELITASLYAIRELKIRSKKGLPMKWFDVMGALNCCDYL